MQIVELKKDFEHLRLEVKEHYVTKSELTESEKRKVEWGRGVLWSIILLVVGVAVGYVIKAIFN